MCLINLFQPAKKKKCVCTVLCRKRPLWQADQWCRWLLPRVCIEAASPLFELGNKLPWDLTVLFKTYIKYFTACVGKSTFVLLTLLIPDLGFPLNNGVCNYVGIVLQNGYQVANRLTDVCGESVIHGNTSEVSMQRAGCVYALVNIKWLTSVKETVFCNFELAYLPCRLHPPDITCDEEDH